MASKIEYVRFPIALLLIFFLGKLIGGFAGLPYEVGAQVFGMVPLTVALCLVWGGLIRGVYHENLAAALLVGVLIALGAQILILGGTLFSYLAGIQTHFNHPMALVREMRDVPFSEALVSRIVGLLVNCILGAVTASIGYSLGGLIKSPPRS